MVEVAEAKATQGGAGNLRIETTGEMVKEEAEVGGIPNKGGGGGRRRKKTMTEGEEQMFRPPPLLIRPS